jgi:hypothetical protein
MVVTLNTKKRFNDKEKRALIVLAVFASILVGASFISSIFYSREETTTSIPLPPHRVSATDLGNDKRIQINSTDPELTPADCINLARAYSRKVGTRGQVVVEKIYSQAPWNGESLPFCYDNQDGKGVQFNEW